MCEFGDAGNGTSSEQEFNLSDHTWEDYRAHASTKETELSSSSGGSTEWRRMCQDSRFC